MPRSPKPADTSPTRLWTRAEEFFLTNHAHRAATWLAAHLGRTAAEVEERRLTVKPTTGPAAFTDFATRAKLRELPSR